MIIEKCQNVVVKVEIWLSADKVSRGHLPIVKIPSKDGKIARSWFDGAQWQRRCRMTCSISRVIRSKSPDAKVEHNKYIWDFSLLWRSKTEIWNRLNGPCLYILSYPLLWHPVSSPCRFFGMSSLRKVIWKTQLKTRPLETRFSMSSVKYMIDRIFCLCPIDRSR